MDESDVWRVVHQAADYDCLAFIWIGEYGIQPVLMPHNVYPYRKEKRMNGNGAKYVTLADDKAVHLYAETEATVCGLPVPVAGGAEWTYAEPDKVCPACSKAKDKAEKALDERAPFDEGVDLPFAAPEPKAEAKKK